MASSYLLVEESHFYQVQTFPLYRNSHLHRTTVEFQSVRANSILQPPWIFLLESFYDETNSRSSHNKQTRRKVSPNAPLRTSDVDTSTQTLAACTLPANKHDWMLEIKRSCSAASGAHPSVRSRRASWQWPQSCPRGASTPGSLQPVSCWLATAEHKRVVMHQQ